MNPIADSSLGSQYWITMDLRALSELYEASQVGAGQDVGAVQPVAEAGGPSAPGVIGGDAVLTSLASGTDAKRVKGAVGQARLLAQRMNGGETIEAVLAETRVRFENLLGSSHGDYDRMIKTIARMNRSFLSPEERQALGAQLTERELDAAMRAMGKILMSRDFAERAVSGGELDHSGRLAFANAALGVLKMAREGGLDLNRTSDFFMGEVLDVNKPADMLRMAVKTARTAREKFIDAKRLNALAERYPDLRGQIDDLIRMRTEASEILDLRLDLGDLSEKTIKSKLKEAREAMRAFRYDFDRLTGRHMSFMESVRRKMDDWFSTSEHRTDAVRYNLIGDCERRLGEALRDKGLTEREIADAVPPSRDTSRTACELTHATNNHIRYFFTGVESRRDAFAAEVHKLFDPIVAEGGSKTVFFEAGVDVRAGGKIGDKLTLDGRAGGRFMRKAKISVAPGGGSITVTYFTGGGAEASVEGNVGIGEWNGENTGSSKTGGSFGAHAAIGGGRGKTVVYRSLDEFIRDCRGGTSLTRGVGHSFLCLGKIWQATRAFLRFGRNLANAIGLCLNKSKVDNNAYRSLMQRSGVISELDTILSRNDARRVFKASETSYDVVQGGIGAYGGIDVRLYRGIDANTGKEKNASVFKLDGSIGYDGESQRRIRGAELRAHADTLRQESADLLRDRLAAYRSGEGAREELILAQGLSVRQALGSLAKMVVDIENRAASEPPADDAEWRRTCRDLKAVMVQYVLTERRLTDEILALESDQPLLPDDLHRLEELKSLRDEARTFFGERLTSPKMDIPEDVFRDELTDVTNAKPVATAVHTVTGSIAYDVATDYVSDVAKSDPKTLQIDSETDGANVAYGKSVGQTAIKHSVQSGMKAAGLTGKLEVSRTVTKPDRTDVRPWVNDQVVTWEFKLTPNLPIRLLVEKIAEKMIDENTDGRPADLPSAKKAAMKETLLGLGVNITVEALVTEYANLTIAEVAKAMATGTDATGAQKFFAGPLMKSVLGIVPLQGLEVGFDMARSKSLVLRYEHGRRACFSVTENMDMSSTLGARAQVGPVGVGFHITSGFNLSNVERSIYLDPHFDTWLGRAADFLRAGSRPQLAHFLAHNRKGALKAFDAAVQALAGNPAAGSAAAVIDARLNGAVDELAKVAALDGAEDDFRTRSLSDRARSLQDELASAVDRLRHVGADATDADKLDAFEGLLVSLVRAYGLAKEAES